MISVAIEQLRKIFRTKRGEVHALRGVDLRVEQGEFCVLLGPSGSGKTTLLRCVAGLEKPDGGEIRLGEQIVYSDRSKTNASPEDRGLGMVFQSYAIWPHLTVFENVALPLTQGKRKIAKHLVRERVAHALQMVQMGGYEDRPAPLLSGGQQQRVALARALAVNPKALLMDEPLSNLDARLRESVRSEIRGLVKKLGITVLYVTHDQVEAMALADRVAVFGEGQLLQMERPQALYRNPADSTVAEFFGAMNWLEGRIEGRGVVATEIGKVCVDAYGMGEARLKEADRTGSAVVLGIRPEDIEMSQTFSGEANVFMGEIVSSTFLGDHSLYELQAVNKRMLVKAMGMGDLQGTVSFRIQNASVFPKTEA